MTRNCRMQAGNAVVLALMLSAGAYASQTTFVDVDRDGIDDAARAPAYVSPDGGPSPAAPGDIIGVAWGGSSFALDSETGTGVLLGPSGVASMNAMSRSPDGTLYATKVGPQQLLTIDPDTGVATVVANLNPAIDVRGLGFHPNGTLYAVVDESTPDALHTIDPNTGATARIGATGTTTIQGLAVSQDGTIYAWDLSSSLSRGLMTLDPNTGVATDVNPNVGGRDMQALDFGPDGTLFGGRDQLYTIDVNTGEFTLVGSGGYADVRGFAFRAGGVDCDAIVKFKVSCRNGKLKANVKAPDLAGQQLTLVRNNVDERICNVNNNGKCKVNFGRQNGEQTVAIRECPDLSKRADCG